MQVEMENQADSSTLANDVNVVASSITQFVGRILIERQLFQNTHIPHDMLIYLINDVLNLVHPKDDGRLDVVKQSKIFYKELMGIELTEEEQAYNEQDHYLDVFGEVCNGLMYSSMFSMGYSVLSSVYSAYGQNLLIHIPVIVGAAAALYFGPQKIQSAIDVVLSKCKLSTSQKQWVQPWLNTVARLALGCMPKVHATEEGVHYHFPSTQGHTVSISKGRTLTRHGDDIKIEHSGKMKTPEGTFPSAYIEEYKLHQVEELTDQRIKLNVKNKSGATIPVEFHLVQSEFGPYIEVRSDDAQLTAHWSQYFPKPINTRYLFPSSEFSEPEAPIFSTCQQSLMLGAVNLAVGLNPTASALSVLPCLPTVSAAVTRSDTVTQSLMTRCKTEYENENYLDALHQCKDVINHDSSMAEGYYYLGLTFKKLGMYQDANNAFKKSLSFGQYGKLYYDANKEKRKLKNLSRLELQNLRSLFHSELGIAFPTHFAYLAFSKYAYCDKNNIGFDFDGWEILSDSKEENINSDGYYGIAFFNKQLNHIVIAHRGSTYSIESIMTDSDLVLARIPRQADEALNFLKVIATKNPNVPISHTGHSLGAALAEYVACNNNSIAVTADSPGINSIDNMSSCDAHIITYVSYPNIVNTLNTHIGEMRHVSPSLDESVIPLKDTVTWLFPNLPIDEADKEYVSHSIDSILHTFKSASGYPDAMSRVLAWPEGPVKRAQMLDFLKTYFRGHNYIPHNQIARNSFLENKLRLIGYDDEPFDLKTISLNIFTPRAQKFLNQNFENFMYPENINPRVLMLFEKTLDNKIHLISDTDIFTVLEFKDYIELKLFEAETLSLPFKKFNEYKGNFDDLQVRRQSTEETILFSIDEINKLSDNEKSIIRSFIDLGDVTLNKYLLEKFSEETIATIDKYLNEKYEDSGYTLQTLAETLVSQGTIHIEYPFTKVINRPDILIGKSIHIPNFQNSGLINENIIGYKKESNIITLNLENGSAIKILQKRDLEISEIILVNSVKHNFLDYLKIGSIQNVELTLLRSQDLGNKIDIKEGDYNLKFRSHKDESNVNYVTWTLSNNQNENYIIDASYVDSIENIIDFKVTHGGQTTIYKPFDMKWLDVYVKGSDKMVDIDSRTLDLKIKINDKLVDEKREQLKLLAEIKQSEKQLTSLVIAQTSYLDAFLNNIIQNKNKLIPEHCLTDSDQFLQDIKSKIKNVLELYNKAKIQKSFSEILYESITSANYQRLVGEKFNSVVILNAIKLFNDAIAGLADMKGKDIGLYFTRTGWGGSSSLNVHLGHNIVLVTDRYGRKILNLDTSNIDKSSYSEIGLSTISTTPYLQCYSLVKSIPNKDTSAQKLCVGAGLDENRSIEYTLANALSIDYAIRHMKSLKYVVLVIPYSYIDEAKGTELFSLLNDFKQVLPDAFENSESDIDKSIFFVISKHVDKYTNNKDLGNLIKRFSLDVTARINAPYQGEDKLSTFELEQLLYRKKIWDAFANAFPNNIDRLMPQNEPLRRKLLTKYMNAPGIQRKSFSSLANKLHLQEKLGQLMSVSIHTWQKQILERYLIEIPKQCSELNKTKTELKLEITNHNQTIKDNIDFSTKLESTNNQHQATLEKLEKLKNNKKKLDDDQELKSILDEYSKTVLSTNLATKKEQLELQTKMVEGFRENAMALKKKCDDFTSAFKELDKTIKDKQKLVDEYSTGEFTDLLQSFSMNPDDKLDIHSIKAGAIDKAVEEIRELDKEEIVEGSDKTYIAKEYKGILNHLVYIERQYSVVPFDKAEREDFIKKGFEQTGTQYRAVLKCLKCTVTKVNASPTSKKVIYSIQTKWEVGTDIPWFNITHIIPKIKRYETEIINLSAEINAHKKQLAQLKVDMDLSCNEYQQSRNKFKEENEKKKTLEDEVKTLEQQHVQASVEALIVQYTQSITDNGGIMNKLTQTNAELNNKITDLQHNITTIDEKIAEQVSLKSYFALVIRDQFEILSLLRYLARFVITDDPLQQFNFAHFPASNKFQQRCADFIDFFDTNKDVILHNCAEDLGVSCIANTKVEQDETDSKVSAHCPRFFSQSTTVPSKDKKEADDNTPKNNL